MPSKRILLVEDQPVVAMSTRADLEELGYEVVGIAESVEKALQAVRGSAIDAVLLDSQLHGDSARSVAMELRDRQIPFVLITGYADDDAEIEGLTDAPILRKPFMFDHLRAALENLFIGYRS